MKKSLIVFAIGALLLAALALWVMKSPARGSVPELVMTGIVLLLVGFALLVGLARLRSHLRREPAEDEFSKAVMNRAAALSFYGSLYLWLAVMYYADRSRLPAHALIGYGIVGMAALFLVCWIWVRFWGMRGD